MIYLSIGNGEIATAAQGVLRTIIFSLDELIYKFIIILYNIFSALCNARLMNNELIAEFAKRIGLILGLVMFFYVAFDIIQILLDPDKITDKEKGPVNIIKKCIIVVLLLGLSSYFFNILTAFQTSIIKNDTIGKIILPYDIDKNAFGNSISANLMTTFYSITDDPAAEINSNKYDDLDYESCKNTVEAFQNQIVNNGEFSLGYNCLNERYQYTNASRNKVTKFYINFNYLSIVVGCVIAWMLIMYCISVGMRVIQLTLLQIVSPVAFVSYLSPKKDNMLSKWWKIYFSTYIDVFIRIGIIDLVIYICGVILDNFESSNEEFWKSIAEVGSGGEEARFWIMVFMIIALLSFAKKAPDLIKELIPQSASKLGFGLGLKDHAGLGMVGGALAGGVTGLIGGIAGGKSVGQKISGAFGGIAGGIGRGFGAGAKAKDLRGALADGTKNQAKANLERAQRVASGGTIWNAAAGKLNASVGKLSSYELLEMRNNSFKDLKAEIEDDDDVKGAQSALDAAWRKYIEDCQTRHVAPVSYSDWTSGAGSTYKSALDKAKDESYKKLFKTDDAFRTKVEMHNKRFRYKYDDGTSWSKEINPERKKVKAEFERRSAQKPRK